MGALKNQRNGFEDSQKLRSKLKAGFGRIYNHTSLVFLIIRFVFGEVCGLGKWDPWRLVVSESPSVCPVA